MIGPRLLPLAAMALTSGAIMAPSSSPSPPPRCLPHPGAANIAAGTVALGEDGAEPGAYRHVAAFAIDRQEVAVGQFRAFVAATRYRTAAEREGGGAVFVAPASPQRGDLSDWWQWVPGAQWRYPLGPSAPAARDDEPVRQVTLADAEAFAAWRGRKIPTEAQWERAARGGDNRSLTPADWAYAPSGKPRANTWQGVFPILNEATDGFAGVAPVGCFESNGHGVQDMIGNVWEWALAADGRAVIKGGSYLCAFNFCTNFKPAARIAQDADLPTSHIGFRTVADPPPSSGPYGLLLD